jgi:anti-anti-sigma regulatory factor
MATIAVTAVDAKQVLQSLEQAREQLGNGELALDFSSVRRLDAGALRAMETLAGVAENKAVKIELQGVNIDVYRVLKLAKLAPRFTFSTATDSPTEKPWEQWP